MHLSSLLLLGLSAGAFSFPISSLTSSLLDKRFLYSWVGASIDPSCSVVDYSDYQIRPKLHKDVCTLFIIGMDEFLGIN